MSGASAAGGLGAPPPPPPDAPGGFDVPSGFDALRKPPIPVSFLSHEAGWVQFQYPPSARDRVSLIVSQADDLRAELAEALAQSPLDGVEVRVARGPEEMSTLAPRSMPPPAAATGVGYVKLKLLILSLSGLSPSEPAELASAFRRELAKLALGEALSGRALPAFFIEGFALHFSREREWSREWQLYRSTIRQKRHAVSELDQALERGGADAALASAEAGDFVESLLKPERHAKFAATIERIRQGDEFESAVASGYGSPLPVLEREWRKAVSRRTT
ncbi:MAG TPA: hypothetical protein VJT73_13175, partial [Polyangiaceae bacterium]|nr:hypothetical protein [Polyangiaceae bacterium]